MIDSQASPQKPGCTSPTTCPGALLRRCRRLARQRAPITSPQRACQRAPLSPVLKRRAGGAGHLGRHGIQLRYLCIAQPPAQRPRNLPHLLRLGREHRAGQRPALRSLCRSGACGEARPVQQEAWAAWGSPSRWRSCVRATGAHLPGRASELREARQAARRMGTCLLCALCARDGQRPFAHRPVDGNLRRRGGRASRWHTATQGKPPTEACMPA